ncbi:uncharacterized protein A4U43_C03F24210 [Asparagus officinalis]|uniref:Uncharacterized protein n=1 Tax=Asparagus officinalis TaxID=4686 RepID=A0A5P1FCJ0_ASPOF|nr:uncharacterized protein A4U43_C03F24210 [Asparagus officinalis]
MCVELGEEEVQTLHQDLVELIAKFSGRSAAYTSRAKRSEKRKKKKAKSSEALQPSTRPKKEMVTKEELIVREELVIAEELASMKFSLGGWFEQPFLHSIDELPPAEWERLRMNLIGSAKTNL